MNSLVSSIFSDMFVFLENFLKLSKVIEKF